MFGGKNEKGEVLGTLRKLSYDPNSLELNWSTPFTKGQSPANRFQHTMAFYPEGNYLIVCGGRSGDAQATYIHHDVKILYLESFTWVSPKLSGDICQKERFGHSACVVEGQMIVFGGKCKGNLLDERIAILELSKLLLINSFVILIQQDQKK